MMHFGLWKNKNSLVMMVTLSQSYASFIQENQRALLPKPPTQSLTVSANATVKDCLLSFPKGSSPGLDGYRAEHLLTAIKSVQNKRNG